MEGRFNGGFFCITGLGGLYLEGLIHGVAYNFSEFYMERIKEKKELMDLIERYGGQGSLANHHFIMNHYIMNGNT